MAQTNNLRNVCLISHGNAGKTSLLEAMLYHTKVIDRLGKVEDGNTISDYDAEEIKRGISINAALAPVPYKDIKINLIDAPGYFDFVGEQLEAAAAADGAVIVISGKSGVSAGTEKAWETAKKKGIPVIFFVNKMDNPKSDYEKIIAQMKDIFGKSVAPFTFPIKDGDKFKGYIDIVTMQAKLFDSGSSTYEDIPADMKELADANRDMLLEAVAEVNDEMMEKYFSGEPFTDEEIRVALKTGIGDGSVAPVICGAAYEDIGIHRLLHMIYEYMPAPDEAAPVMATDAKTGDAVELKCDPAAPFAAQVFKTVVDPYIGKMSIFKVLSGVAKPDMTVVNASTGENEKLGKLYTLCGKKQTEVKELVAGDIGVTNKLGKVNTCDTLCDPKLVVQADPIPFPKPVLSMAIVPKDKNDEDKIGTGLARLLEEDPTFKVEQNTETKQMVISGTGEQHLNIIVSKLASKFGVSVNLIEPKVPYRETIRKKVKVEGKHKKQSGGHGQYGHVWIEFEPCESEDLIFEEQVFGGSVPKNYFPAVEKGLRESMAHGVVAGYPVVNLKATLLDGSYHPVDSSEMAFKTAASLAYKAGLAQANPVLLEPIGSLKVVAKNAYTGDIVGDINKRRGRILGMNPLDGDMSEVVAEVPLSEMTKYATDLRAITNGRGSFDFAFDHYEEAPAPVREKVVAESQEEK
ncbi:MAG: elongation factor G [Ruminococcaceae bacterium]|nr:elongation factor G [Oscillospiraceae bacterium]